MQAEAPFVISAAKGLAEQRIPNMMGIMQSKRKPLNVISPSEASSGVEVVEHTLPPAKSGVTLLDPEDMDQLVKLLHEEAKVI